MKAKKKKKVCLSDGIALVAMGIFGLMAIGFYEASKLRKEKIRYFRRTIQQDGKGNVILVTWEEREKPLTDKELEEILIKNPGLYDNIFER
jgi:hypothetical protein